MDSKKQSDRDQKLRILTDRRDRLERELVAIVPEYRTRTEVARLGPADLASKLPPDTVFIDFVRYRRMFEKGQQPVDWYVAFVVAPRLEVKRVELGPAAAIDESIMAWRQAIDKRASTTAPGTLRKSIWDKLASHLPKDTRSVYLAPDGDLARLPFPALPGKIPDTVLLEELQGGMASVPHGHFLLEHLIQPRKFEGNERLLAVGAVRYDRPEMPSDHPWPFLPGTEIEIKRVFDLAVRGSTPVLTGHNATSAAVLKALPQSRYAHLATHGFFDEQALSVERKRSTDQLVNWQYAAGQTTERIGVGSRSPLGYVGLVLAGANSPEAIRKHSGIISGEAIVDLPLEGLRLCVLSACETGLGEYTSGEGVQGLQRAFHLAGCPNVVASLWKVGDVSTAVLMEEFYKRLWDKEKPLSPIEALREAQLTILRNPDLVLKRHEAMVAELKKQGFSEKEIASRGFKSDLVALPEGGKVGVLKRSPTQWWAAFALSGVGK